ASRHDQLEDHAGAQAADDNLAALRPTGRHRGTPTQREISCLRPTTFSPCCATSASGPPTPVPRDRSYLTPTFSARRQGRRELAGTSSSSAATRCGSAWSARR